MKLRSNSLFTLAVTSFLFCTAGSFSTAFASGFYGDGSSGALVIDTDTDWTTNPPPVNHAMNLEFTTITVNAKWTIPSGLIIMATGDVVVGASGSIVVERPPLPANGNQYVDPGVTFDNGLSVGPLRAVQILRPGIIGGSAGGPGVFENSYFVCPATRGGGTLGLRVGGNLQVDGLISATGESGQSCSAGSGTGGAMVGSGGGGGGVVIMAVQSSVTGSGTIDVSGGNGGNGKDGVGYQSATIVGGNGSGGGGGIIHIICPNPIPALNFVVAGGQRGAGSPQVIGAEGGASGGNSGGYPVAPNPPIPAQWHQGNGYGGYIFFSQPASPEDYFHIR